jgi:hypothetical protein
MNSQYLVRSCPTCGSAEGARAPAAVVSQLRAEDLSLDRILEYVPNFSRDKVIFSYHRCPRCGQLYCPRYFQPDQLAELYSDLAANMEEATPEAIRHTQLGYVRRLFQHQPVVGDFLEIGPDRGYFAEAVLERRPATHCWLFEPNQQVHRELLGRLKRTTAELFTEMFDLSSVPAQRVAMAAMVHVLDHLPEPRPYLNQVFDKLLPGGLLVVVVHNERSLLPRLVGSRCPIFHMEHPQLFNRRTLPRMLRDVGFTEVDIVRATNYFPLAFLIQSSVIVLFRTVVRPPGWLRMQVPVKLGNLLAVARKPIA